MGKARLFLALILSLSTCKMALAQGQNPSDLENFLKTQVSAQELLHLTDLGYGRIIPPRFLTEYWTAESFERLAQDASKPVPIDSGLSLHHALAHAGSEEAAALFRKMKNYVSQNVEPNKLSRNSLIQLATKVYWEKLDNSVSAYLPIVTGVDKYQIQTHGISKARYERIFEQLNSGDIESIVVNHLSEISQLYTPMSQRLLAINLFLILKSIEFYADPSALKVRVLDQRIVHYTSSDGRVQYGVASKDNLGLLKIHWLENSNSGIQITTEEQNLSPSGVPPNRLKNLLRSRFKIDEIFQFTAEGLSEIISPVYFVRPLTPALCREIATRFREINEVDLRSSAPLQIFHTSSDHAGATFDKLARIMDTGGISQIQFSDLRKMSSEVYEEMKLSEGIGANFHIKIGAFHPVVNPKSMSAETMEKIEALFSEDFQIPQDDHSERGPLQNELSERALQELTAIRLSTRYFENEFDILKNDLGGWEGNIPQFAIDVYNEYLGGDRQNSRRFVCTDEAMTTMFFIYHLIRRGIIKEFELVDFRFAHRFKEREVRGTWYKQPLTDHFGVLLRHKISGRFFVVDTWVKNGGEPAHLMSVSDWNNHGEAKNLDTVGIPSFLEGFDSYLNSFIRNKKYRQTLIPSPNKANKTTPHHQKKNCEPNF